MLRLRVKELAQQQGISQGKLARKADVDIKTLARIYKNPYAEVSSITIEKLARALSVSIADLIEEVDDEVNKRCLPGSRFLPPSSRRRDHLPRGSAQRYDLHGERHRQPPPGSPGAGRRHAHLARRRLLDYSIEESRDVETQKRPY